MLQNTLKYSKTFKSIQKNILKIIPNILEIISHPTDNTETDLIVKCILSIFQN